MRRINRADVCLLTLVLALSWSGFVEATPLDKLIGEAKKEGTVNFYGPATLTPQGAGLLEAAFNKKYGLNTKLTFHPSLNMTRDVGKFVGMAATGVGPEWDTMVVTDAHYATLWLRKLVDPYDYKSAGVDPQLFIMTTVPYLSLTRSFFPPTTRKPCQPTMCRQSGRICWIPSGRAASLACPRQPIISLVWRWEPGAKKKRRSS